MAEVSRNLSLEIILDPLHCIHYTSFCMNFGFFQSLPVHRTIIENRAADAA
jgi:hypothetical protein